MKLDSGLQTWNWTFVLGTEPECFTLAWDQDLARALDLMLYPVLGPASGPRCEPQNRTLKLGPLPWLWTMNFTPGLQIETLNLNLESKSKIQTLTWKLSYSLVPGSRLDLT